MENFSRFSTLVLQAVSYNIIYHNKYLLSYFTDGFANIKNAFIVIQ